jgi:hypothetical protein
LFFFFAFFFFFFFSSVVLYLPQFFATGTRTHMRFAGVCVYMYTCDSFLIWLFVLVGIDRGHQREQSTTKVATSEQEERKKREKTSDHVREQEEE